MKVTRSGILSEDTEVRLEKTRAEKVMHGAQCETKIHDGCDRESVTTVGGGSVV